MKISRVASIALFLFAAATPMFAQGPIAPTGPPGPTMKSLDQIEARTPISSLPFTINSSGSYYLTKNLSVASGDGITINASDVTLDLNGFTISSTAPNPVTGTGILTGNSLHNISISNGHISGAITYGGSPASYSGSGFYHGIYFSGGPPQATRVYGVTVSGCKSSGINLSSVSSTVVESCAVNTVGGYGIAAATVNNCTALQCGFAGIAATNATNCFGACTASDDGIFVGNNATNCNGTSVNGNGVEAGNANNCTGTSTNGAGIKVTIATGCQGTSSAGYGIQAKIVSNCFATSTSSSAILSDTVSNSEGNATGSSNAIDCDLVHNSIGTGVNGLGIGSSLAANSIGTTSNGSVGILGTYGVFFSYGKTGYSNGDGILSSDGPIDISYGDGHSNSISTAGGPVIGSRGVNGPVFAGSKWLGTP